MTKNGVQRSPELEALVGRWNTAIQQRDARTLRNLLSASEHLRYIGTAEDEIWSGLVFRSGYAEHIHEIPDIEYHDETCEAFERGDVGWAYWSTLLVIPSNDMQTRQRVTFVFVLEDGQWKINQVHGSNPTSNLEKLGIEHHALNALLAAAQQDYTHDANARIVTVMFTDIAGSSALALALGDRRWAQIVGAHLTLVGAAIADNGGKLVKSLGDGTMSTFDSAQAAMAAAVAIQSANTTRQQDPALRLRVGLHTGDVVQAGDDFFGTVVNKAARIAAAADPGGILVSDATRIVAGQAPDLWFDPPQTVALRGLGGEHSLSRLIWA